MLAILIICLVIFGAISLPIGIAMGLATMLCLVFATNIDPIMVAQNAFAGIDSFSLMAIPFFMLAGNFMRYGGISKRLLDLADNIVGFFTGGLGAITTFPAMFYAAISGSGPATVSAIGSFMIPEMEEKGYDKGYATALSAAAGTIGVIIPPSIPFVIYGVVANCSIADMFKAGILPGVLIGVVLMIVNYIAVTKNGYGMKNQANKHFSFRKLGKTLKELDPWSMRRSGYVSVKESVFPFRRFPGVDILLGPEMRSTGEVLGLSTDFGDAFFKAEEATRTKLPTSGCVLISVNDRDKAEVVDVARGFYQLGFEIMATGRTCDLIEQAGIPALKVCKLNEGRPNILDKITDILSPKKDAADMDADDSKKDGATTPGSDANSGSTTTPDGNSGSGDSSGSGGTGSGTGSSSGGSTSGGGSGGTTAPGGDDILEIIP